uniref:Myotilin n=1 Tax=Terrapene triunguis TaxID=2587831 RepID=A0A674K773_9SAUR
MFNYERPKHFIQSQNTCQGKLQPPGPKTSAFSSSQTKQSSILIQPRNASEQKFSSSSSLSSPIFLSSSSHSSHKESAFPITPASAPSPAASSSGQRLSSMHNQSPAAFLCSVLPSQSDYNSQAPSTVESNYSKPMYTKQASTKPTYKTSDREIQGTKEALIQDLERKLRGKDNLLHNGNQRLTYEERMARRLLGPENAASVLVTQNEENLQNSQQQNSENTRLQVPTPQNRSRPSSRGEWKEHGSIQEKFFQPRFVQVPEDKMTVEEGRFCRIDFKVRQMFIQSFSTIKTNLSIVCSWLWVFCIFLASQVSGLPAPDLVWYLNGRLVHPDDFHKMIVSEKGFYSLIFEVVRGSDAGTYECVASNRAGEASFTVQLDVTGKIYSGDGYLEIFILQLCAPKSVKVFQTQEERH